MQRFKNVVMAIIISISVLFIFNIFFLNGLFNSMETEAKQIIDTCIEEADNVEIQIRLNKLATVLEGGRSISINKEIEKDSVITAHTFETPSQSICGEHDTLTNVHTEALDIDFVIFENVEKEIRLTVHQNIDTLLPVNLHVFDSLLTLELYHKGVDTEVYYSEIVDDNTNKIIQSSYQGDDNNQTKGYTVRYAYYPEKNYAYKIHMDFLTSGVLKQMSGILISTFLIIVLLGIAFWYLIRTILQQKTLEEIKTDFINNMTHELKTPIAVAYSAADTLLNFRQGDNKEKRKKYLQVCIDQLSQLSELVEQILSMRMERHKSILLNKEPVGLEEVIHQLIDLHQLKSKKQVVFKTNIVPEDMTLYADRVHVSSIISNLIDNAIKYSLAEVTIEIAGSEDEYFSILSIKDDGIGLEASSIEHIFDKFYRVPNGNLHNVKGSGLGLFYVKQIIEKHGGSISVKSKPNKSSIFTIQIPRT